MMYQSGPGCFSTPAEANSYAAAQQIGSIKQIGTAQYVVDSTAVTASSITYVFRNVSNNSTVTTTEIVNPLPCQALTYEDAASLAWPVAAAWLGVYALTYLARYLTRETHTQSDYGNT
mgnify:CR=1 FL=1